MQDQLEEVPVLRATSFQQPSDHPKTFVTDPKRADYSAKSLYASFLKQSSNNSREGSSQSPSDPYIFLSEVS